MKVNMSKKAQKELAGTSLDWLVKAAQRKPTREQMLEDALLAALPFVEDAAEDEVYKAHRVHKVLKQIREALAI
jgi:hypothetical protein